MFDMLRNSVRCLVLQSAAAVAAALLLKGCTGGSDDNQAAAARHSLSKCSAIRSHGNKMICGEGVPLCGVLTLQTGKGSGAYRHSKPEVHGLWPESGRYGTSQCSAPQNSKPPTKVFDCYDQEGNSRSNNLRFERHEWDKHGVCAGTADAADFFSQVCALAAGPLKVMEGARSAHLDLVDTAEALQRAGYCVWETSTHSQIELSACAGADGRWKLADSKHFESICGNGPNEKVTPPQRESQHASPEGAKCVPHVHGPKCKSDSDCEGLAGCLRCANSGFCTAVPLR